MAPAITARAIYSKAIKSRSGHLPSSPPSEKKTTARQDQTRQASADDGTGDGACNLDIVDAHIEEGYVISFFWSGGVRSQKIFHVPTTQPSKVEWGIGEGERDLPAAKLSRAAPP
jgi:hypothetical protein